MKLHRNSNGVAFETVERHLRILPNLNQVAVGIATPVRYPACVRIPAAKAGSIRAAKTPEGQEFQVLQSRSDAVLLSFSVGLAKALPCAGMG